MKRRHEDGTAGDITTRLQSLVEDDRFLTDLSLGKDPSGGDDELASLLLGLREDVEKPMPSAPRIEGADETPTTVISLESRRHERSERRGHRERSARQGRPFLSGLIGAAAATLVIAGSGSLLYNASPGSPLWGMSSALFSERAAVVELAGTLEEIDSRAAEGDMSGTRELLEEARRMVGDLQDIKESAQQKPSPTVTSTVTSTVQSEPVTETVTETATQTETATVEVPVQEAPLPESVEPTPVEPVPTPTSTPQQTQTPGPVPSATQN